jgi:trans-2,3-dihydro-3-hydroxyanthranilate isomerase
MAASYDFVQLDVFTRTPLAGNPLAIFTDARGLTGKQMQALARERAMAADKSLKQIVKANRQLLEEDFPLTYYSRQLLFSDRARESWVEPDLKHFLKDVF